jgi:hypothetical protein
MKITKSELQNMINEELASLQEEQEAAAIIQEIENWGQGLDEKMALDATTLEKGAKAAARVGDVLGKVANNKTAAKYVGRIISKVPVIGPFLADLLMDIKPEDVEGLKALGTSARGQLDTVAKTTAQPIEATVAAADVETVAMAEE